MAKKDKEKKPRQVEPAALGETSATLGIYQLGGVIMETVGSVYVYPAQPVLGQDVNWPTTELMVNTPVRMLNNQTWRVALPPVTLEDGRVQVKLKWATRPHVVLNVPADALDAVVWNTGQPRPVPPPEEEEPPIEVPSPEPDPVEPNPPVAES